MKRAWIMTISIVLGVVLICGVTLVALLNRPDAYPFVQGAAVVRSHEYIQPTFGGHSQFAREGVYRFDASMEEVAASVEKSLKPPSWRQTRRTAKEIKYDNAGSHVTLQSRQTGGTTVFIQEFREATFADDLRMWWKKRFKS